MLNPRNTKPPAGGRTGARANIKTGARDHTGPARRLPPYSKTMTAGRCDTLMVLTGSQAWDRAKSESWFPGRKLVLPIGENPRSFDWSIAAGFSDCIVFATGDPEPAAIIMALAGELLRYLSLVLYQGPGPLIRFETRRAAV
jgi:hypothetical protein